MTDVSDDFNRANGGLGANWTTSSDLATAGGGSLQISSNAVVSSPTSHFFASYYNAASFSNDQHAQAIVSGADGQGAGVVVRHQGTARSSFYALLMNIGAAGTQDAYYVRYDNGTINVLQTIPGGAGRPSGATIGLRITGSTLIATINGVDQPPQTDTTYTSGLPGVLAYSAAVDNFAAGPLAAADQTLIPALLNDSDTIFIPAASNYTCIHNGINPVSGSTRAAYAFTATLPAGNLLVLYCEWIGSGGIDPGLTVTDTVTGSPNTYTIINQNYHAINAISSAVAYCRNPTGIISGTTVGFNFSVAVTSAIIVHAYPNFGEYVLDKFSVQNTDSQTGTFGSGVITPSMPGALLVGFAAVHDAAGDVSPSAAVNAGLSWAGEHAIGTATTAVSEDRMQGGAPASIQATFSCADIGARTQCHIVSFVPSIGIFAGLVSDGDVVRSPVATYTPPFVPPPTRVSVDKRELILEQVLAVLAQAGTGWAAAINGEQSVFRNRAEIPTDKLPALVLLDGRETVKNRPVWSSSTGLTPGATAPAVYILEPQVFIVLKPRDTIANEGVGPELSMMRIKVLDALLGDDNLGALLGANGGIGYLGHETDLQTGSTVVGQMQMNFQLSYVLDPSDLS